MTNKNRFRWEIVGATALLFVVLAGCVSSPAGVKAGPVVKTAPADMQNSYFVRANGNDKSDGRSERAAFQTLARAIQEVTASSIRTITVIGSVSGLTTEITNCGPSEILISGTPDLVALLSVTAGSVVKVSGSKVRFEHIMLSGGKTSGVVLLENSTVTLGSGAVIKGSSSRNGGAALVNKGSTLIMQSNAVISGNSANIGGGVAVYGTLTLKDNAVIENNGVTYGTDDKGNIVYGIGGGVYIDYGVLTMQDNAAIRNNEAYYGAGIYNWDGAVTLGGNARIEGNATVRSTSNKYGGNGGGIYLRGAEGVVTLGAASAISKNEAGYGAGVYIYEESSLVLRDSAAIRDNEIVYWTDDDKKEFGNNGAGIMISSGSVIMQDDSIISGNQAGAAGGGVWVGKGSTFTHRGGSITGNSATFGGGIYVGAGATYTTVLDAMRSVTGNTADNSPNIYFDN
jgi:hypothetical protein